MEICLKEMNKKWDQSVYGSWHNYQNELILMFLWGIQTPDLVSFLTPINDVKGKDSNGTFSPIPTKCLFYIWGLSSHSFILDGYASMI